MSFRDTMAERMDAPKDVALKKIELDEQIEPKINWKQVMGCVSASLLSCAAGISVAYTSSLFPALDDPDSNIQTTAEQKAWIASSGSLSAPIGAIVGAFLMERIGRLGTIQLSVLPFCISWIIIATANSFTAILIGRILIGAAIPMGVSPSGVLIAETALKAHRGALTSVGLSIAAFGVLCGYVLGAVLDWRTFAWVSSLSPLAAFALAQIFTAESPLWLRTRGRMKAAHKASLYYYNDSDYVVQAVAPRCTSIQADLEDENPPEKGQNKPNFLNQIWMLLTRPSGLKPLAILTVMFLLQNLSGLYVIMVYAVPFFQAAGTTIDPYFASIMIGIVKFISSLFQIFFLRHCGRRSLMLVGSVMMALCMGASAYATSLALLEGEGGPKSFFPAWFVVACVVIHQVGANTGIQTVPWAMSAELFPQHCRGTAQSINFVTSNVFMFATLQAYPWMLTNMGGAVGIQYFFAGTSILAAVFTWIFLPETHEKSLTEIEEYFVRNTMYLGHKKYQFIKS